MNGTPETVSLAALGVTEDPGCAWHPRADKAEAYDADGNLRDLSAVEVAQHQEKPEATEQPDAGVPPLAAEDSHDSPEGQV